MSMYPKNMFFTSESVTEGHPDKFCDQISLDRMRMAADSCEHGRHLFVVRRRRRRRVGRIFGAPTGQKS
jgi:hypothetical protein